MLNSPAEIKDEIGFLELKRSAIARKVSDRESFNKLSEPKQHMILKYSAALKNAIDALEGLEEVDELERGRECSTMWADKDRELPYVFDLYFDIKTEGQLLKALLGAETGHGGEYDEILDIAHRHGYTMRDLKEWYAK